MPQKIKIVKIAKNLFKRYILRDQIAREAAKWFKDNGDQTLRLNYPLDKESVVFDVGGYHGDFASQIQEKYDCTIYLFEPVEEFFNLCSKRFKNNPKVICLKYGLSAINKDVKINLAENASSFSRVSQSTQSEVVKVRSVTEVIRELNVERIDLMKINIEGGEFEVLPLLISEGVIDKINNIQVQFHKFIEGAIKKRKSIRDELSLTHEQKWCYPFIWESWQRR